MENNLMIFPADGGINVLNHFPADKYNLLIPTKIIQETSPAHKVIIRQVEINTDLVNGGEIYKSKDHTPDSQPGRQQGYELTKKAIDKFMGAANVQIYESKAVTPSSCVSCVAIAKETRTFPDCTGRKCSYRADVAWEVKIRIPEGIGSWRLVTARKEIQVEVERKRMADHPLQFERFFPHRASHCETKALSRAVRKGLSLKISYTMEELKKPFVVALLIPNMDDPHMKAAAIDAYFGTSNALFKNVPSTPTISVSSPVITHEVAEPEPEDQEFVNEQPVKENQQAPDTPSQGQPRCSNPTCNKFISKGEVTHSTEKNGRLLCFKCQGLPQFKK